VEQDGVEALNCNRYALEKKLGSRLSLEILLINNIIIIIRRTSVATVQLSASVELSSVSLPLPKYQSTLALGLARTSHDSVTGSPISAATSCDSHKICGMSSNTKRSVQTLLIEHHHHHRHHHHF